MKVAQGGTQKWCPNCKAVQVCTAVNPSQIGEEVGQRWHFEGHSDIQWFRRGLICKRCNHEWLSAEVPEDFIDELIELREALKEIKLHSESYAKESARASKSLAKLSASLNVLRALKLYRSQE
jgi:hypothetical protein